MPQFSCKSCQNKECFIHQNWIPEWADDLIKYQIPFKQGQNIVSEGAPVLGIYFILTGKVKVFFTGLNAKHQIVRFASEGHIIGHRGFGNDVYPISAVAMEDSLVCFVENATLMEMFMSNPKFTLAMMMFYSRELRKMENRMKNIAQMNVREKVAEALLLLQDNFGLNKQKEINVPFSREDIANTAGTNVEQVTRQITDFESEGLISKTGRKIGILNLEGLQKIISIHNQYVITK